jgi:hypothetical protein
MLRRGFWYLKFFSSAKLKRTVSEWGHWESHVCWLLSALVEWEPLQLSCQGPFSLVPFLLPAFVHTGPSSCLKGSFPLFKVFPGKFSQTPVDIVHCGRNGRWKSKKFSSALQLVCHKRLCREASSMRLERTQCRPLCILPLHAMLSLW